MPSRKARFARVARWCLLTLSLFCGVHHVQGQPASLLLGQLFRDHAVIQRDAPVRVWGTAAPGETVAVELAGVSGEAVADEEGRWSTELPGLPAGGPHVLSARASSGASERVEDVLVGDVFLCTGQSNMALPVSRSLNASVEARRATDERIRMLTVPLASSPAPREAFPDSVAWEVASPETVPDWSATCYYFARDLRAGPLAEEDVPVGLVTAAWGGSSIRAWMSAAALASVGGYDDALEVLRLYSGDEQAAQRAFGQRWQAWWEEATGDAAGTPPWQPDAGAEWKPAPDGLGDWTQWDDLRGFTGMVWFRATVDLTAEQAAGAATLALGAVDEVDQTWINGRVVGNTFGYGTERTYPVPAGLLHEGENVVVVNVLNTYATGGLIGDDGLRALHLADGTRLPLGDWRYLPVRDDVSWPPRAPWESVGGLSTIHNAMVAPLRDFGIRAVLWYQGESNTGEGDEYAALLRALMAQWRGQFGGASEGDGGEDDLPVLVVQLPNYGPWPTEPAESGWAEVREAQRLATRDDPNAALAVTIDVGDPRDLHPANKQAVGARLARAARHVVYGEPIAPSGPRPLRAERRGDVVAVSFDDVEGALVAYGGVGPLGFELCGREPGSCRYAEARVDGSEVSVRIEGDEPVDRVRHAWADSPIVTLFDEAGLPVGPFELPVTPARQPGGSN